MLEIKTIKNYINPIILILIIILQTIEIENLSGTVLVYSSLGLQALYIIVQLFINKNKLAKNGFGILLAIIIMFIVTIILDFLGDYFNETLTTTLIIFFNMITIFFIVYTAKENKDEFRVFSNLFITYVAFLAIYGIIIKYFGASPIFVGNDTNGNLISRQYFTILGFNFSQIIFGDANLGYAITALTRNPNTLSSLLLFAVVFLINKPITISKQTYFNNIIKILLISIMTCALYFAGSRINLFLLIIYFVIFILFKVMFKKYTIYNFLILLLSILIIGLCVIQFTDISFEVDFNGRIEIWAEALKILEDDFFFFSGLGSSGVILEELNINLSLHNTYLKLFLEYGVIITAIIIILNILILIKALKLICKKKNNLDLITLTYIYVAILIISFLENTFFTYCFYNTLYFYAIFMILKSDYKD